MPKTSLKLEALLDSRNPPPAKVTKLELITPFIASQVSDKIYKHINCA